MRIEDHRLLTDDGRPVEYRETPNMGGALRPSWLVMHFTAGRDCESSVSWLTRPEARASAHLVIGRDGRIVQLAPFDRVTWHAGRSHWRGVSGLNAHSVGIELDNAGRLERAGGGWQAWFGGGYADEDVMIATHRNETRECGWHRFTERQLDTALEAAIAIVRAYRLEDVIGHDDISPGRKSDPGPAFPMTSFRGAVSGREEEEDEVVETIAALNIRTGPGIGFDRLPESPLAPGTRLLVLDRRGVWLEVEVRDAAGEPTANGYVHGNYVRGI